MGQSGHQGLLVIHIMWRRLCGAGAHVGLAEYVISPLNTKVGEEQVNLSRPWKVTRS